MEIKLVTTPTWFTSDDEETRECLAAASRFVPVRNGQSFQELVDWIQRQHPAGKVLWIYEFKNEGGKMVLRYAVE